MIIVMYRLLNKIQDVNIDGCAWANEKCHAMDMLS